MDMTNPFSKQIDECYNPLVLAERVKTFYNIVRERMLICSDNVFFISFTLSCSCSIL